MKLLKMSNFTFFQTVFFAICIFKSLNSHISVVVCSFFEFGIVWKWCIREWIKHDSVGFYGHCRSISDSTDMQSDLCSSQSNLTLSQTTNFRLFQTEKRCRRQFHIWWKWLKAFQTDRKHCVKRKNSSLRAISPFPTVFSKDLYCKHVKTRDCLEKG